MEVVQNLNTATQLHSSANKMSKMAKTLSSTTTITSTPLATEHTIESATQSSFTTSALTQLVVTATLIIAFSTFISLAEASDVPALIHRPHEPVLDKSIHHIMLGRFRALLISIPYSVLLYEYFSDTHINDVISLVQSMFTNFLSTFWYHLTDLPTYFTNTHSWLHSRVPPEYIVLLDISTDLLSTTARIIFNIANSPWLSKYIITHFLLVFMSHWIRSWFKTTKPKTSPVVHHHNTYYHNTPNTNPTAMHVMHTTTQSNQRFFTTWIFSAVTTIASWLWFIVSFATYEPYVQFIRWLNNSQPQTTSDSRIHFPRNLDTRSPYHTLQVLLPIFREHGYSLALVRQFCADSHYKYSKNLLSNIPPSFREFKLAIQNRGHWQFPKADLRRHFLEDIRTFVNAPTATSTKELNLLLSQLSQCHTFALYDTSIIANNLFISGCFRNVKPSAYLVLMAEIYTYPDFAEYCHHILATPDNLQHFHQKFYFKPVGPSDSSSTFTATQGPYTKPYTVKKRAVNQIQTTVDSVTSSSVPNSTLQYTKVLLSEDLTVYALLDSGATTSFISSTLLNQLNIPIMVDPNHPYTTIKGFTGETSLPTQFATLTFYIDGLPETFTHKFFINTLKHSDHSIVFKNIKLKQGDLIFRAFRAPI